MTSKLTTGDQSAIVIDHYKANWFPNSCQNVRKLTTIRTFWQ